MYTYGVPLLNIISAPLDLSDTLRTYILQSKLWNICFFDACRPLWFTKEPTFMNYGYYNSIVLYDMCLVS